MHHIEQRRHIRRQAIDYFIFRIRRELGALSATLGGLDALVFTGGIGENASKIRARICAGMEWIGIDIDAGRNSDSRLVVSSELSRVRIMTIPTHKEIVIAQAAAQISSSPLAC